jgi:trk system potassium uptake protein TrkA
MKIVVIGLGNFGMALAVHLADSGNEVIAADLDIDKIELIKDKVSHAVALDATNEDAYHSLPLKSTDLAIVAIGQKDGASLMSTAIIKKLTDARIVARSSSNVQDTIYEAMGVDQIIHPELEYAERLTKKINLKGSIDNFELDDDYLISEVSVSDEHIGQNIQKSNFRGEYNLNIVTILRKKTHKNFLGRESKKKEVLGMPKPDTVFERNDVLVVFGKNTDIQKYLEKDANRSNN